MVQSDDQFGLESLGQRDHRGIGSSQWKFVVLLDERADSHPVLSHWGFDVELRQPLKKASFGLSASSFTLTMLIIRAAHCGDPCPVSI